MEHTLRFQSMVTSLQNNTNAVAQPNRVSDAPKYFPYNQLEFKSVVQFISLITFRVRAMLAEFFVMVHKDICGKVDIRSTYHCVGLKLFLLNEDLVVSYSSPEQWRKRRVQYDALKISMEDAIQNTLSEGGSSSAPSNLSNNTSNSGRCPSVLRVIVDDKLLINKVETSKKMLNLLRRRNDFVCPQWIGHIRLLLQRLKKELQDVTKYITLRIIKVWDQQLLVFKAPFGILPVPRLRLSRHHYSAPSAATLGRVETFADEVKDNFSEENKFPPSIMHSRLELDEAIKADTVNRVHQVAELNQMLQSHVESQHQSLHDLLDDSHLHESNLSETHLELKKARLRQSGIMGTWRRMISVFLLFFSIFFSLLHSLVR